MPGVAFLVGSGRKPRPAGWESA